MSVISTFERLRQLGTEFRVSSDCSKIHLKEIRIRDRQRERDGRRGSRMAGSQGE